MAIYCVYISRPSHFTAWIYAIKSALPTPPAPYPSLQDRHAQVLALVATFGYAQLRSIVDYLKEQTALPTLTLTVTKQVCPY